MRRKVTTVAMGDSVSRESMPLLSNIQLQDNVLIRCAKRLRHTACSTAQALYAITYVQRSPSIIAELMPQVCALAAILSSLEDDLLLENESTARSQKHMWTSEHHKNFTRSIQECDEILMATSRAVRRANERLPMSAIVNGAEGCVDHFQLDNGSPALDTIVKCFHLVHKTKIVVRHTALSRVDNLQEEQAQELLRLTRSLQHPDLDAIWALKSETFPSKSMQMDTVPSRKANATPVDPLEDAPTPSSKTPESYLKIGKHTPREEIPPIWAYNQWPPFGNHQHPAYLAAKAKEQDEKRDEGSMSKTSPASTQSTKPLPSPDSASQHKTVETKPGEVTFGEPSIIKPAPSSSLFANIPSSAAFATYSQSKANPFTPTERLETYILRPTVHTTELTTVLSYDDEPLQLSKETMQAHMLGSGPKALIVGVLLDLHPQQLHLMQRRAVQRHGNIVSVQHGKSVNLETVMGSLQVKPTIYLLSTTTVTSQKTTGPSYSTVVAEKPTTTFATSGPGYICGGLFGPKTIPASDPVPVPANPPPVRGLFQDFAPASVPGFGFQTTNSCSQAISRPTDHFSSPEAYSRHLQEKGETCTHVEGTERKGAYQHYQTITTNKDWHGKDRSLEEIRLADYKVGRTGRGLFEGLSQISNRPLPLSTEANVLKAGWRPKPHSGDDVTSAKSSKNAAFPISATPPGTFAGYTVDNSGTAPTFSKSSAWPALLSAQVYAKPSLGSDCLNRPAKISASSNPFAHFLPPTVPPQASCSKISGPDTTTMGQPTSDSTVIRAQGTGNEATQSLFAGLTPRPHSLYGPPVGATDPSDQSKWITHPQRFCEMKHQHGIFCRVSPAEVTIQTGNATVFPVGKPLSSSGFGIFAGASSQSPFAALTTIPLILQHQSGPDPGKLSDNNASKQVGHSKLHTPSAINQCLKNESASLPQSTLQTPGVPIGCQIWGSHSAPVHNKFDSITAGPQPLPPSWTNVAPSAMPMVSKPGCSGADGIIGSTNGFFSGRVSDMTASSSTFGRISAEQNPPSVWAMPATTKPPGTNSGSFLGPMASGNEPVSSSCSIEPNPPSGLVGSNPFGQATVPTPSLPSQPKHGSETPTRCSIFSQPSHAPTRPGGLFGNTKTTVSVAPSIFGQPSAPSHSTCGNSLFGTLNAPNYPLISSTVKNTEVFPSVRVREELQRFSD